MLKMEIVSQINIFGLRMMMKRGSEQIFSKFLHEKKPFSDLQIHFIKRRIFVLNYKFIDKNGINDLVCTWRDIKKILCDIYRVNH